MWLKSNTTPKWLININVGITSGRQLARANGPAVSHLVWSANAATYSRRGGFGPKCRWSAFHSEYGGRHIGQFAMDPLCRPLGLANRCVCVRRLTPPAGKCRPPGLHAAFRARMSVSGLRCCYLGARRRRRYDMECKVLVLSTCGTRTRLVPFDYDYEYHFIEYEYEYD